MKKKVFLIALLLVLFAFVLYSVRVERYNSILGYSVSSDESVSIKQLPYQDSFFISFFLVSMFVLTLVARYIVKYHNRIHSTRYKPFERKLIELDLS